MVTTSGAGFVESAGIVSPDRAADGEMTLPSLTGRERRERVAWTCSARLRAVNKNFAPRLRHEDAEAAIAARALTRALCGLRAGDGVTVAIQSRSALAYPTFSLHVNCTAQGPDLGAAQRNSERVWDTLAVNLAAHAPHYLFESEVAVGDEPCVAVMPAVRIAPQGVLVTIGSRRAVGFSSHPATRGAQQVRLVPTTPPMPTGNGDAIIRALGRYPEGTRVAMTVRALRLENRKLAALADGHSWLAASLPAATILGGMPVAGRQDDDHMVASLRATAEAWLRDPIGYLIECVVIAPLGVDDALLSLVADEVFGAMPTSATRLGTSGGTPDHDDVDCAETPLDLGCALHGDIPIPWVLPSHSALIDAGLPASIESSRLELPDSGLELGSVRRGAAAIRVKFHLSDRARHCYICGATGTGKSTLLFNMVTQDIRDGSGVMLIDPHGDLFGQVLSSVPPSRRDDVIVIDPSDGEWVVGLNPLECGAQDRAVHINFVTNELMRVFDRLYNMREAGGPIFEQYMRNALMLVMDNDVAGGTILDVLHVFEDPDYRRFLMRHCRNRLVESFWSRVAERVSGEHSIANLGPYITSKLNQFTHNVLVRSMVGQSKSTVDFRSAMDCGRIVIINLANGVLGEFDTALLGMLLIGKTYAAAMARTAVSESSRRPFHLYVDEFQQFTTDSVASMLSGARKFGLQLTLANQTLSQLLANRGQQNILDAVLGNCGTVLCFRLGVADAERMESYMKPELSSRDLQDLPNYQAATRLMVNNAPSRPFVLLTDAPRIPEDAVSGSGVVANSRARHARRVSDVEAEIASRRDSPVGADEKSQCL